MMIVSEDIAMGFIEDLTAIEERVVRLFLGVGVPRQSILAISDLLRHEYQNPTIAAKYMVGDIYSRLSGNPRYADLVFPPDAAKWAKSGLIAKRRK